ncbi:bifunctional adenosylcobinamide kinase/adenosylcobinamide-phosphate guanylyltransferase [Leekyejoonella antrihumi]|uniref:Adenosylcobinamide kinase n=1 Tax=Leekyejoonella antrihumi TaxID=1660198 RepID=A0A563E3C8_9MICO|nr:bifunctional adenosylcobinamide kinase/adenosylcobinamide-phosphate guanylyltransferase [Leekyejoonella antrihumi]TWP37027.1 bifunctional adenosylcobinamide kinase/adenosylcobinamide-phosphate guanylyltransferase [Leekyejoonella antrihumi]
MTTTLVLGGVRSGKSRHATRLLPQDQSVTVITPGGKPTDDDPAWASRVAAHRAARPNGWTTAESSDVTRGILRARTPVLVDCLGTWVTAIIDAAGAWDDREKATELVTTATQELVAIWANAPFDCVAVSNEVGMSLVAQTASGRLFQDLLGQVNAQVSAVSHRTHLVVAGRVLDLSDAPLVG